MDGEEASANVIRAIRAGLIFAEVIRRAPEGVTPTYTHAIDDRHATAGAGAIADRGATAEAGAIGDRRATAAAEAIANRRATAVAEAVHALRPVANPRAINRGRSITPVSYTHLRAHETPEHLVCRLLLE